MKPVMRNALRGFLEMWESPENQTQPISHQWESMHQCPAVKPSTLTRSQVRNRQTSSIKVLPIVLKVLKLPVLIYRAQKQSLAVFHVFHWCDGRGLCDTSRLQPSASALLSEAAACCCPGRLKQQRICGCSAAFLDTGVICPACRSHSPATCYSVPSVSLRTQT